MATKTVDKNYEYQKIAKERSIWLLKPLTILGITVWAFYPTTALPETLERNALMGFLLGAVAGLVVNMGVFKHYLFSRRQNITDRKNRMPDEYYFGKIKEVKFVKDDA